MDLDYRLIEGTRSRQELGEESTREEKSAVPRRNLMLEVGAAAVPRQVAESTLALDYTLRLDDLALVVKSDSQWVAHLEGWIPSAKSEPLLPTLVAAGVEA